MLLLDKLWEGEISPGERRYRPGKEYGKHLQKMEKCENAIKAELSEQGKVAFEDFLSADSAISAMEGCDSFIAGFRMATLMMLDVFQPSDRGKDFRV